MALSQSEFEERACEDPYAHMSSEEMSHVADMDIIPVDATKHDDLNSDMSWGEQYIGSGGVLTITDYGRHRDECDTLADFREMVRERIRDDMGRQYLKVMDDDKERVADTLVAISRASGFVVLPRFE